MTEENTPDRLDEIDALRLQCGWAEVTNIRQQIQINLLQNEKALREKTEALQRLRAELIDKYKIDPNVTTRDAGGRFIPITPEIRRALDASSNNLAIKGS